MRLGEKREGKNNLSELVDHGPMGGTSRESTTPTISNWCLQFSAVWTAGIWISDITVVTLQLPPTSKRKQHAKRCIFWNPPCLFSLPVPWNIHMPEHQSVMHYMIITWGALWYFYSGLMKWRDWSRTKLHWPQFFFQDHLFLKDQSKKILVYLSIIGLVRDEVNIRRNSVDHNNLPSAVDKIDVGSKFDISKLNSRSWQIVWCWILPSCPVVPAEDGPRYHPDPDVSSGAGINLAQGSALFAAVTRAVTTV